MIITEISNVHIILKNIIILVCKETGKSSKVILIKIGSIFIKLTIYFLNSFFMESIENYSIKILLSRPDL